MIKKRLSCHKRRGTQNVKSCTEQNPSEKCIRASCCWWALFLFWWFLLPFMRRCTFWSAIFYCFLFSTPLLFLVKFLFCFCYTLFFLVELVLLTSARKLPPQEETPNEAAARVLLLVAPTTQFLWGCEEPWRQGESLCIPGKSHTLDIQPHTSLSGLIHIHRLLLHNYIIPLSK